MFRPFKKLKLHEPSLPQPAQTAAPELSKVVSNPTRLPINRQAALAIRQKRCWIEEPPPEKPRVVPVEDLTRAEANLKIERNNLALVRDELGASRALVRELRQHIASQEKELGRLRAWTEELNATIKQLEDLKL